MSAPAALPALPFPQETADALVRLTQGLEPAGLWWLSGYAAGLASRAGTVAAPGSAPRTEAAAGPGQRLTILYGSQTGNARRAAEVLFDQAQAAGLPARLLRADAYPTRELAGERLLYVVISTQGEGDPPDDAIGFVEFLSGRRAPKLPELKYAVLGLGDTSYADFCGIACRIDARLAELGAAGGGGGQGRPRHRDVAGPWRSRRWPGPANCSRPPRPPAPGHLAADPAAPGRRWSHGRPFRPKCWNRRSAATSSRHRFPQLRRGDRDVRH